MGGVALQLERDSSPKGGLGFLEVCSFLEAGILTSL